MTFSCSNDQGFKSVFETQPDNLDSERHGHIYATGQSKCDE